MGERVEGIWQMAERTDAHLLALLDSRWLSYSSLSSLSSDDGGDGGGDGSGFTSHHSDDMRLEAAAGEVWEVGGLECVRAIARVGKRTLEALSARFLALLMGVLDKRARTGERRQLLQLVQLGGALQLALSAPLLVLQRHLLLHRCMHANTCAHTQTHTARAHSRIESEKNVVFLQKVLVLQETVASLVVDKADVAAALSRTAGVCD